MQFRRSHKPIFMKNLLPVLLSLCISFAFSTGPDYSDPQDQEIIAPIKAVFEGFFHQNAELMATSFSSEATFISSNGRITHGKKAIEDKHFTLFLLTGPLRADYQWDSLQLNHLSADIAFATLRFSATVYTGDEAIEQKASCSAILQKSAKGWEIRLFQMTAES